MTRLPLTPFIAAGLLTLAACGGSDRTSATPAASGAPARSAAQPAAADACALVTAAEVESITGVKVGQVAARTPSDSEAGACEYRHADTAQFGSTIVAAIAVYRPDKVAAQSTVWTSMLKTEPVAGIGDTARYNEAGSAMFVRQGSKAIYVQVLDNAGGGAARAEALKKLAALALPKL